MDNNEIINRISVIIYAHNDETNIEECIKSAKLLTNNLILIDIGSNDQTTEKARDAGLQHIFTVPYVTYVEPARSIGIQKANTEWIFILDTDERITSELASEIKKVINDKIFSHYKVPRKEYFGRTYWLKYGGWWPNYQIRLINKNFLLDWPKDIHSTPSIEGELGILKNALLHYSKNSYEQIVKKTLIFEDMESDLLLKANRDVSIPIFFRKYIGELYRRLFRHKGFLDGDIGIIESIYQAYSKTITYLFLYEKKKSGSL